MSQKRSFENLGVSDMVQAAMDEYRKQERDARSQSSDGRSKVFFATAFAVLILGILTMAASGVEVERGETNWYWNVMLIVDALATLSASIGFISTAYSEKLKQLPEHTREHRGLFIYLINRIDAWRSFRRVIGDMKVEDLGEMGEFALDYQKRLDQLCERWDKHLTILGGADIHVTQIHHAAEELIPTSDLEQLKSITAMVRDRGRLLSDREFRNEMGITPSDSDKAKPVAGELTEKPTEVQLTGTE